MSENKNLVLAISLSLSILFGFQYFYEGNKKVRDSSIETSKNTTQAVAAPSAEPSTLSLPLSRDEALTQSSRILIRTSKVRGSINLVGAKLDDLSLVTYHEKPDPQSPEIILLTPHQIKDGYFIEFGWQGTALKLPNANTVWEVDASNRELTPTRPVKLTWNNEEGLKFERLITIDENYLFTIVDKVTNNTLDNVQLKAYSQITRINKPKTSGYYILHEGALGVFDNRLKEIDYDKLLKENTLQQTTTGGWLGFTDKYWLVALIPPQEIPSHVAFYGQEKEEIFRCLLEYDSQELKSGQTLEQTQYAFSGAKVLGLLDSYEKKHGFKRFDLAVDFGWFYFLTKPLFYALEFFHQLLGNLGLAILLLTILVKILFFPLANKSFRSMARMKALAPKMEKIKERFSHDKVRMNQELMNFYRQEKVNPMSGCLPMLIQAPIFFCLYKVFFVTIEMRHAPFYGWIFDLSAPDPTSVFNLFGLLPWVPPSFLMIGVWPLLMGLTMILQQRLGPQPADPVQAKMMLIMPIVFTYLFASFPAGLVIYWAWSNILTIAQQWIMIRYESRKKPLENISSSRSGSLKK